MKFMQSSFFRACCAILIGALLIYKPGEATSWLIMAIGVLFLLPGVFSIIYYITSVHHKEEMYDADGNPIMQYHPLFPIVGIAGIILGLWLIIDPLFFVATLMYVLGIILVIAGGSQIYELVRVRRVIPVATGYYFFPTLLFLVGIAALLKPLQDYFDVMMIVLGCAIIVYGLIEMLNSIKIRQANNVLKEKEAERLEKAAMDSNKEETVSDSKEEDPEIKESDDESIKF